MYGGMIFTNAGKDLLTQALTGKTLTFTKVKIGEGTPGIGVDPATLTNLINTYKEIDVTSVSKVGQGLTRIRASFTNAGFPRVVNIREIGVFAKINNGTEILYSYTYNSIAEEIPSDDGINIVEKIIDTINYVDDADNVTAIINETLTYALVKDVQDIDKKTIGLAGTSIEGYIQDQSSCIGGKSYLDKITGNLFEPANLADRVSRAGTWISANSDWKPLNVKNLSQKIENINLLKSSGIFFYNDITKKNDGYLSFRKIGRIVSVHFLVKMSLLILELTQLLIIIKKFLKKFFIQ